MDSYQINVDGKEHNFLVFKRLTEPCHQCGVEACGKEDILWYETAEDKVSLVYDGSTIDIVVESFLSYTDIEKSELPVFISDWNMGKGWSDCWVYQGYSLDVGDLHCAIAML